MRSALKWIAGTAALFALVACEPVPPSPKPQARPPGLAATAPKPTPERSAESLQLERYYTRVENDLLVQGLLRQDGGGADTPFNKRQLVENFTRIAMFNEYTERANALARVESASVLRRWSKPIVMAVEFGASVPEAKRKADRAEIQRFTQRLSRLTGLPIRLSKRNANFHVLILHEDERRAYGPRLQQLAPGITRSALDRIVNLPRSTFCVALSQSVGRNEGSYDRALAVIRAEHPDILRTACLHEEIAQALGLANDSAAARPSIFNDDEEFGRLTTHDELLLRILYDPRMKTGMTVDQARPTAEVIAAELLGGPA
ncbi:DUF2927 domain-containing protein [Cognatishimia sp. MH4019]|uniref:DUF2927 domain-containing protein n=1 Tax=Cognatishimia sp. MH4019 TaxID=2854030 RepID=UPI001CD612B6|nr:DUF2927 domain-containing protein [Cognatishimia sp. MH4019]